MGVFVRFQQDVGAVDAVVGAEVHDWIRVAEVEREESSDGSLHAVQAEAQGGSGENTLGVTEAGSAYDHIPEPPEGLAGCHSDEIPLGV